MAKCNGPDIPVEQRYSKQEVKEINKKINDTILTNATDRALSCLNDIYSQNLLEFVTVLQDPYSQKIINHASKHGIILSPFMQPKSKTFNAEENKKLLEEIKSNSERIQYLVKLNVIDKDGNVNDRLDLDYLNSIDVKKLEGYVKQRYIDFANKVDEFERENQLTQKQLDRRFTL
jgi:hypothetical protein